jgi:integrase
MTKYHSTFRQQNGEPFPPRFVNAKIRNGILRTYYRAPNGRGTIEGARLLRMVPNAAQPTWIIEAPTKWWNAYWALKAGKPMPTEDGAEPVVEKGGLVPGSFDALIFDYKARNGGWQEMQAVTRDGYDTYLDFISEKLGSHKVEKADFDVVTALINKKRTDKNGAAIMLHRILGMLFEHARLSLKWVSINPVRDIKKPKSQNPDGIKIWTDDEVAKWRATFDFDNADGTPCIPRRFLEMEIGFGARGSDLVQLGWKDIDKGVMSFRPQKTRISTGKWVHLDATDQNGNNGEYLAEVLARCPKNETFFFQKPPHGFNQYTAGKLVAFKHEPRSKGQLEKDVREWRRAAGISELCSGHGLRKVFATMMANRGVELLDLADALGDTPESAMIYIKARDAGRRSLRASRRVA